MKPPPPVCLTTRLLFIPFFILFLTLSFTSSPLTDAFSDSLFARLQKRLQYLARAHNNELLGSNGTLYGNTSEAPPPPPLLIERVIERLHKERELAFDQIVPEAAEVLKKLAADGDLKACYSDSIKEVKVNLFKRTLGDVVRHFFKLYQDVLEDGLLTTILHRIRALVGNIRFIARTTVECLLKRKQGLNVTRIGLTPLAAYTHKEFIEKFLNPIIGRRTDLNSTVDEEYEAAENVTSSGGRSKRSTETNTCSVRVLPSSLPPSWDWRAYRVPGKGYSPVTPIRSQGSCSSCFVFASVSAMESVYMMSAANAYSHQQSWFSEQALLNCVAGGCDGGFPKDVYRLAIKDGLVPAHTAPYRHVVERCDHTHGGRPPVARPSAYCEHYGMTSDAELQALVYQYGPVVSAVSTSDRKFQVLEGPWNEDCSSTAVDHAVLTVGYTPTHWIIKNSWGPNWGVDGYLMLARDNTNRCGIYYQGSAVEFEGGIIRGGTGGEQQQQQQQQPAENEYARDGGHIFDFFHHY